MQGVQLVDLDRHTDPRGSLQARLGEEDRELRLGFQYVLDEADARAECERFAAQAVDGTALGPDPGAAHSEPRWWREGHEAAEPG